MSAFTSTDMLIYVCTGLVANTFSGIAGAGGGFIMTPLLIFLGLSPAQAVATGKITGLSVSLGSIGGLKNVKPKSKKQLMAIIALAFMIGLLAPRAIINLDSLIYRRTLGALLIVMIPIVIFKRVGQTESQPSRLKQIAGYSLLVLSLGLQAVFSGGMGTLVTLVMMGFLGMDALTANITKRYSQVILNLTIFFGVLFSDLIIWKIAIAGIFMGAFGGFIGGRIAVKKGNKFVMYVLVAFMLISGLALILGKN